MTTGTGLSMLIETAGLGKVYLRGNEEVIALRNADLSVSQGEFVVIVGPSGGGKSTLLYLLGGIDRPTYGKLNVNGIDLVAARGAAPPQGIRGKKRAPPRRAILKFYN